MQLPEIELSLAFNQHNPSSSHRSSSLLNQACQNITSNSAPLPPLKLLTITVPLETKLLFYDTIFHVKIFKVTLSGELIKSLGLIKI